MSSFHQIAFVVITLFFVSCLPNTGQAQPEAIPDVTDITSMTAVSFDSARYVQFIEKGCQDSTYFVGQVQNWKGSVEYRGDLKSYVISSTDPTIVIAPNTMVCGYFTYIICDCSRAALWLGKSVTFSGRRYQARGVLQRYGGETVLYLHMTAVKRNK